jgi:hypothetical protein
MAPRLASRLNDLALAVEEHAELGQQGERIRVINAYKAPPPDVSQLTLHHRGLSATITMTGTQQPDKMHMLAIEAIAVREI